MKCFEGSIYLIFTFTSVAQSKIFWEAERKGSIDEDFLRLLQCPKYFENIGPHGIQSCIVIEKSRYITLPVEEESAESFNKKVLAEEIWENIKSRNLGYVFNGKTCSLETVLKAFTKFLDDNVHDDELLETFFVEFNRDDFVGTTNITPKGDKFWIFKDTAVLPSLMLKRKSCKELVIYYAKVVWWIVYFGHFQLFSYLVRRLRAAGMSDDDLFGENDFEKSRLLILGCYSGSCDVVQLLLEHVPRKCIDTLIPSTNDTSTDTEKSEDLFDKAVVSEREDGIFYFSNFESSNSGYYSPLSAAVQTSKHITELLVSKGATINSRFGNKSPLYIAALNGRLDVVDYLLNQGASSSIGSKCRYYHFSFSQDDTRVEECEVPPISAAAMNNHSRIVVLLFNKSKEIDFTNMPYLSPLCMSITHCQCEVLENLLLLGVDENMPKILSAACMAARLNNMGMLKLLKRHKFDINGGNGFLSIPLYEAAYYGHLEMFNFLLQEGADLKLWCRYTVRKPLHAACSNGHFDIVKRIVKEVDKPKTMILSMDSKRKTAIDLARENNNKDIVSFLSEYLQGLVVLSKSAPV